MNQMNLISLMTVLFITMAITIPFKPRLSIPIAAFYLVHADISIPANKEDNGLQGNGHIAVIAERIIRFTGNNDYSFLGDVEEKKQGATLALKENEIINIPAIDETTQDPFFKAMSEANKIELMPPVERYPRFVRNTLPFIGGNLRKKSGFSDEGILKKIATTKTPPTDTDPEDMDIF